MLWIPCTSACIYQSEGVCSLESAAAVGMPSPGGACIHFIPAHPKRPGLPHRYCGPEGAAIPENFPEPPPRDMGPHSF